LSLDDDNTQWQDTMMTTCNNAWRSATSTYIVQRWYLATTTDDDNAQWVRRCTTMHDDDVRCILTAHILTHMDDFKWIRTLLNSHLRSFTRFNAYSENAPIGLQWRHRQQQITTMMTTECSKKLLL